MNKQKTSFSFPAYRNLSRYLGEMDALVELTELSARSFLSNAEKFGNITEYIAVQSQEHRICVNLAEVSSFKDHLSRSYIVTVYQSAERFMREFRKEHIALYGVNWTGDGHDVDPLTVTLRNVLGSDKQQKAEKEIGQDLIDRFQYYRLIRNWTVHSTVSETSNVQAKFDSFSPFSPENEAIYAKVSAPNSPMSINFDDFILFTRLTKQIAERLCVISQPPTEHWVDYLPQKRFKRLLLKPERLQNAIEGKLRTQYGMDAPTAKWIAQEIMVHWRNG